MFGRIRLFVCHRITFENIDVESLFCYAGISSESEGQVAYPGHRGKVKFTGEKACLNVSFESGYDTFHDVEVMSSIDVMEHQFYQ